eukprot:PLAT6440.1.p2 GENE.PLAT6440.1~~PLAT6440.1.p2  ORF type:complete len:534 (-),score=164.20 PLAT6440.1:2082-3683(-)
MDEGCKSLASDGACMTVHAAIRTEREEEDDKCAADELASATVPPTASHELVSLPEDVIGDVVAFLPSAHAINLSSTSTRLRLLVLGCIHKLSLHDMSDGFPVACLVGLNEVALTRRADLSIALPALARCTAVRTLALHVDNRSTSAAAALVRWLPAFCNVHRVELRALTLTAAIGEALSSCTKLRHLLVQNRMVTDESALIGFLAAVASCQEMRTVCGIDLLRERDKDALLAALSSWKLLEEVTLTSACGLRQLPATLAACCHRLTKLSLSSICYPRAALGDEDADALANLPNLRHFRLGGCVLPTAFFSALPRMAKLEQLQLHGCCVGEDAEWDLLPAAVELLPLSALSVTLQAHPMPAAAFCSLLSVAAAHGSLLSVRVGLMTASWSEEEEEAAAAAFARALCCSRVCDWMIHVPLHLLTVLREWNGHTPAAAVRRVELTIAEERGVAAAAGFVALLLRCMRSCPTLTAATVHLGRVPGALISKLVAAVRDKPLSPLLLTIATADEVGRKFGRAALDELRKQGLQLEELWV